MWYIGRQRGTVADIFAAREAQCDWTESSATEYKSESNAKQLGGFGFHSPTGAAFNIESEKAPLTAPDLRFYEAL